MEFTQMFWEFKKELEVKFKNYTKEIWISRMVEIITLIELARMENEKCDSIYLNEPTNIKLDMLIIEHIITLKPIEKEFVRDYYWDIIQD